MVYDSARCENFTSKVEGDVNDDDPNIDGCRATKFTRTDTRHHVISVYQSSDLRFSQLPHVVLVM